MFKKDNQKHALDDLVTLASGLVNVAGTAGKQIKEEGKSRIAEMIEGLDLVSRVEHEHALKQIQDLQGKVDALMKQTSKAPKTKIKTKPKKK